MSRNIGGGHRTGAVKGKAVQPRLGAPRRSSLPYIQIKLQNGPIGEVGVNGAQIDEVIAWCRDRLLEFERKLHDSHTAMAAFRLDQALVALAERTKDREIRGVEGTARP